MAGRRPRRGPEVVARLSPEAAAHFARVFPRARAGCMAELRAAGCSEEEAEEIFAAVLERVMSKLDPPAEGYVAAQTVALLKRACRQSLIDRRRHRGVVALVPLGDAVQRSRLTASGPAEAAQEREAAESAREAIESLPERERAIFLQRHALGLSPAEILRRNPGLSRRTYRKVLQRANADALSAFERIEGGERCAQIRGGRLRRYLTGQASALERGMVAAHLRHCASCASKAAAIQSRLRELASALPPEHTRVRGEGAARPGMLEARSGRGETSPGELRRSTCARLHERGQRLAAAMSGAGATAIAGRGVEKRLILAASACAAGALLTGSLALASPPCAGAPWTIPSLTETGLCGFGVLQLDATR